MENSLNQTVAVAATEEQAEDPFRRLPEEIIISHIFNQIQEAKSLCRLSLFSKHFSYLVFKTHTVLIKIPLNHSVEGYNEFKRNLMLQSLPFPKRALYQIATAPARLVHGFSRTIKRRLSLSPPPAPVVDPELFMVQTAEFLKKFGSMRSLYVEYDYPKDFVLDNYPVYKWRMCFRPDCLVSLTAWKLDNVDIHSHDMNGGDLDDDGAVVSAELIELLSTGFRYQLKMAAYGRWSVENLALMLTDSLQYVLITDSKKEGKIEFQENDLFELRKGRRDFAGGKARLRFWYAGVLRLPSSGRVMKNVALYLFQGRESQDDNDFLLAKRVFDGEDEGVFAEAAVAMLQKNAVYQESWWLGNS